MLSVVFDELLHNCYQPICIDPLQFWVRWCSLVSITRKTTLTFPFGDKSLIILCTSFSIPFISKTISEPSLEGDVITFASAHNKILFTTIWCISKVVFCLVSGAKTSLIQPILLLFVRTFP